MMKWMSVEQLKPKMIIAKDIKISDLQLHKGQVLTQELIDSIKVHRISWIPISIKPLSEQGKDRIVSIGDGMEIDADVLNFTDISVKLMENVKKETENLLSDVRSGNLVNHKEVVEMAVNYLDRLTVNDEVLAYPLVAAKNYDAYTYSHLINVATLIAVMVHNMDFEAQRVRNTYIGGLYHDIGKINIPDYIIKKPSKLTDEEFRIIKKHPQDGLEIISRFRNISDPDEDIQNVVSFHHERVSGKGYPKHYTSNEIPLVSKIAAVVDVYDALTTDRPYRSSLHPYEAVKYILQRSGIDFDSKVVNYFIKFIGIYPIGGKVKLSNGEVGTVIAINKVSPLKPIIKLKDRLVDLAKHSSIFISSPYFEDQEEE